MNVLRMVISGQIARQALIRAQEYARNRAATPTLPRDLGMEVVYEGIRVTPAEIVQSARDEGVHVIGLSILSGSHGVLVLDVLGRLRDAGVRVPVVVGGIIPEDGAITVVTPKGQINDVEFLMEVGEDGQHVVEDGRFVNAAVLDLKGKPIVRNVRMVFVKDSPPEDMVRSLRRGHRLHVFGLPRIDLSAVAWRARHSRENPELLKRNLPYEIVVVGVYED